MFSLVYISVPPIPITHFSITTYAYVHIEATYRSGPPKTSNSLQHMDIYSTTGPNPDTEQQPQIKKTTLQSHVSYANVRPTNEINTVHQVPGPKTTIVVTSHCGASRAPLAQKGALHMLHIRYIVQLR